MKRIIFSVILLFAMNATAQKQTYLLLAYGQKSVNFLCNEKILIKQEEVVMTPVETVAYRAKLRAELKDHYGKEYSFTVDLVPPTDAVIFCEYEKEFSKPKDNYNCTTTGYGHIRAKEMLTAEKSFAARQAEQKTYSFKEIRCWGKSSIMTTAVLGENDLDVNWITASSSYLLKLKNTHSDIALKVTVISYKNNSNASGKKDISKMTKSNETVIG